MAVDKDDTETSTIEPPPSKLRKVEQLATQSISKVNACTASNDDTTTSSLISKATTYVSPSSLTATTSTTTSTTVYVGNIDQRINETHLEKIFNRCGTILRIHQAINSSNSGNQCYYYAFVEYETSTSSSLAISNIHGKLLLGKHLVVKAAKTNNNNRRKIMSQRKNNVHSNSNSSHNNDSDNSIIIVDKKSIENEKRELDKKIISVKKAIDETKNK